MKLTNEVAALNTGMNSGLTEFVSAGMDEYEKSAPAVAAYLDNLYRRVQDAPDRVTLFELRQATMLFGETWEPPNAAQNRVYKLVSRLGLEKEVMNGGMMLDF